MKTRLRIAALLAIATLSLYWAYLAKHPYDRAVESLKAESKCNVNAHTGVPKEPVGKLHEVYYCGNNLTNCSDSVGLAIERVDRNRWGPFDFHCYDGAVSSIHTSTDSLVAKDHMAFLVENAGLFGLPENPVLDLEHANHGQQLYKGVRVATGVSPQMHENRGRHGDENWFSLSVFLKNTRGWSFSPKARVSKEEAISKALKYWEPSRPKEISEWRTEASYWIRSYPPNGSDCQLDPGGAWFVHGSGHFNPPEGGNTKSFRRQAIVDGVTGTVCSYSGTGELDYARKKAASN